MNLMNQVDPPPPYVGVDPHVQVGPLVPPRVPPVGNPAHPQVGVGVVGARAWEQGVPGPAAGVHRMHLEDYLMNVVQNLAQNAHYSAMTREQESKAIIALVATMNQLGQTVMEGFHEVQRQQQQQWQQQQWQQQQQEQQYEFREGFRV